MLEVEIYYDAESASEGDSRDHRYDVHSIVLTSHGEHAGWQMTTNEFDQVVITERPEGDQSPIEDDVDSIIQPHTQWFSFGFSHRHEVAGQVFDKDTIVRITAIDPRSVMSQVFGFAWSFPYHQRPDHHLMCDLPVFDVSVGEDGSVSVVAT